MLLGSQFSDLGESVSKLLPQQFPILQKPDFKGTGHL